MKKDFLWSLMAVMIAMTISVSLVSCDNDDDNGSSGVNNVSALTGIIDKESGLRLKSFGEYTVYYNNEGLFDSIAHKDYLDDYAFQYGPDKIRRRNNSFYNYVTEFAVNYDKMGRMTSYESQETGSSIYFENNWNGTGSASYTYDKDGHLTSMTQSGGETGIEKGKPYTASWIEKVTLTWENGLLKEIAYEDIGLENARTWSAVYTFGYDTEYVNKHKQWVYFYVFGDNNSIFLPYLGLMGIGPNKLPSSVTFTYKDKLGTVGNDGTETYPCSYEFNADGSVAKANGLEYTYEYATDSK